jgi:hypothetical protein
MWFDRAKQAPKLRAPDFDLVLCRGAPGGRRRQLAVAPRGGRDEGITGRLMGDREMAMMVRDASHLRVTSPNARG